MANATNVADFWLSGDIQVSKNIRAQAIFRLRRAGGLAALGQRAGRRHSLLRTCGRSAPVVRVGRVIASSDDEAIAAAATEFRADIRKLIAVKKYEIA